MDTATTMFPQKPISAPSRGTLPHNLLRDLARRAKAIRWLVRLEASPLDDITLEDPPHLHTAPLSLWSSVNTPLALRTVPSPPPKKIETLGLLTREDLDTQREIPPNRPSKYVFEGLVKATRLLIRHARNIHLLKYGKTRFRMLAKNPCVALKSSLRTNPEEKDAPHSPPISPPLGMRPRDAISTLRQR